MTVIYMHRGLLDGQRHNIDGCAPLVLRKQVDIPSGSASVEYRRTDWFRDGARIYMPAVMVSPDGTVAA